MWTYRSLIHVCRFHVPFSVFCFLFFYPFLFFLMQRVVHSIFGSILYIFIYYILISFTLLSLNWYENFSPWRRLSFRMLFRCWEKISTFLTFWELFCWFIFLRRGKWSHLRMKIFAPKILRLLSLLEVSLLEKFLNFRIIWMFLFS